MSKLLPQNDILLKKEEIQQFENIIGSIPTAYGIPILEFLKLINSKRSLEKAAEYQKQLEEKGKFNPITPSLQESPIIPKDDPF